MTAEHLQLLMQTARESLAATVEGRAPVGCARSSIPHDPYGGLFVTLRQVSQLRGCMGTFAPANDMLQTVREVAGAAARDPRFILQPIVTADLPSIRIEISILSLLKRTRDPLAFELGTHGILIDHPEGRGCFLPAVATECHWTKEEFLSRCCHEKARLPEGSWRDPKTHVYLFTSEVLLEGVAAGQ